ncbi:MAG: MurR/RpiR family transcriptional regulator [Planctomycetota bacterium]|nr:MurR/RpiR family transcriptional regulator [Planctomycetota bacterium]
MSISELIAAVGQRLTPAERRIAAAVLEDPTRLAFGTVSDLAARVGTSHPTVVRFAAKLGFGGYAELQERARRDLAAQLNRPSSRIRAQDEPGQAEGHLEPVRTAMLGALERVFAAVSGQQLAALAAPLVRARRIWILTGETSRSGAMALASGLNMVRPGVHLVDEHDCGRDLSGAEPGDAAVVFDFARYRRHSVEAARVLAAGGIDLVAVTDGPLSPLVELTSTWCQLEVPGVGPFDSSVPSVALAELLVAQVARELRDEASARIDRIEELWRSTGTFLEE